MTAVRLSDDAHVAHLQAYIKRYKTREVAERVLRDVRELPGDTLLEKCILYLLRFVYNEVERKRRTAIQSMLEVARRASTQHGAAANELIRRELLAYLEESPFSSHLEKIAERLNPGEWVALLALKDETGAILLHSVDGARQLLGGCRRMLESYPDHPGLLFLSSFARLLLPDSEVNLSLDEVRRVFKELAHLPIDEQHNTARLLLAAYRSWLERTQDFVSVYASIAGIVLETIPTRMMARELYSDIPA